MCGQLHLTVSAAQINFRLDPKNYSDNNGINYDNFLYMHILFLPTNFFGESRQEISESIIIPFNDYNFRKRAGRKKLT